MFFSLNKINNILICLTVVVIYIITLNISNKNKEITSNIKHSLLSIIIFLTLFFLSSRIFLFFIFFETAILPVFILITLIGNNPEKLQASFYIMLYTLMASLPFLFSINKLFLFKKTQNINIFNINQNLNKDWLFFILIFLAKLPAFFVHMWLPKAHVEAPVEGSIILAGVILKIGGFGVIKFSPVIIRTKKLWINKIISLGVLGSIFASVTCYRQTDLKILIAYSSVAHIRLVIVAMFILNRTRIKGGLIIIIAHGLCSANLFYIINIGYKKTRSRNINLIKSLNKYIPILILNWFIACALNISCPPSINFLSEVFITRRLISYQPINLYLSSTINILVGLYCVYIFTQPHHGQTIIINNKVFNNIKTKLIIIILNFPLVIIFTTPLNMCP